MFKKLEEVAKKYDELNVLLATPEVATDHKRMIEYNKIINHMEEIVLKYREYKGYCDELGIDFIRHLQ